MKLIAIRDFKRVPKLEKYIDAEDLKKQPGHGSHVHDDQVHRGFIFEIGTGQDLAAIAKSDADAAALISLLAYSKCVGDATNAEVVDYVKKEIASETARDKKARELNDKASGQFATEALLALINQLKVKTA